MQKVSRSERSSGSVKRRAERRRLGPRILKNWDLYLLILPALAYILIFNYGPLYGIQLAFKKFAANLGIWGSSWVGFDNFARFLASPRFLTIIGNTLGISLYSMAVGVPAPILFALLLNTLPGRHFKKIVQTVTYAPHFISTTVLVSMLLVFFSPRSGFINIILTNFFGAEPIFFMSRGDLFKTIYVLSGLWQNMGWSAIIYIAALAGISPDIHEAAVVDGAGKLQRILHIDIPGILPTAITLLILNFGSIVSVGFEKVFLMQNSLNMEVSETISTYVYRVGLISADFSYSTAVGLFNSLINFGMLLLVNAIAKKTADVGLF